METGTTQTFPLPPLKRSTWLFLPLLGLALIAFVVLLPATRELPAPAWLVTPFFLALVMTVPMLALRRRRIAIEGHELVVAATFYSRRIALGALDPERARIVDLAEHTELKPMLKTNGFSLPGFHAGHYRLRNRTKAFCLLTEHRRVLVLPQRNGTMLLLSPERPQVLLETLRRTAAG